jgi:hypothetical protein
MLCITGVVSVVGKIYIHYSYVWSSAVYCNRRVFLNKYFVIINSAQWQRSLPETREMALIDIVGLKRDFELCTFNSVALLFQDIINSDWHY